MATAAALEPLEPSEMECPVCHEYFTQPKILPCAHILCKHCLVSWLNSHPDARCPLCRCAIVDPEGPRTRRSAQEVADAMPTDVAMAGLVAGARALSQDHMCVVCEDVAAHFICLDCNDMLCQACNKVHIKQSATKHHTTADMTSKTPQRLAASGHVTCAAHAQEQEVSDTRKVAGELLELLTGGEIQLEAAIRELDNHLLQVEKKTERTLADITATCDDLKKAVDAFGIHMREAAVNAKCKARKEVEQVKSAFMQRKGKLTSQKQLVKRTHDGDVKTKLKTRVEGLDRCTALPVGVKFMTMPTLVMNQDAIKTAQQNLERLSYNLEYTLADLSFLQLHNSMISRDPFTFHAKHGSDVVLSNNRRTAKSDGKGIVFSSQPMEVSLLHEVVIEKIDPLTANDPFYRFTQIYIEATITAGVITADPAQLSLQRYTSLPEESSVILYCGYNKAFGTQLCTDFGKKLVNLPVGSRVGFYLDAARSLHFVADGCDQGVVCKDVPQPCYAFFQLDSYYRKISTLPLTPMP